MAKKKKLTEAEWRESRDSIRMAIHPFYETVSERKRILFAGTYRFRDVNKEGVRAELWTRFLEIAQSFADGVDERSFLARLSAVDAARNPGESYDFDHQFREMIGDSVSVMSTLRRNGLTEDPSGSKIAAKALREILGNPFRPAVLDPSWIAWNGGIISALAQVIYNERRFKELPVLADALEDAGCTETQLLDHLRSPGPHVRGCWALDLILGKS